MKNLYIAIDFDGTIVEENYPTIGSVKPFAKETINKWFGQGHKIIISSCRIGNTEKEAKEFLESVGIKFHCFNTNHPDLIVKYNNDCRKIGADFYIDDKSLFCENIDWLQIGRLIDVRAK